MQTRPLIPLPFIVSFLITASSMSAAVIFSEDFNSFADRPLSGQGNWERMANTADPSLFPSVNSGVLRFDLSGSVTNHGSRYLWDPSLVTTGSIFVLFDLTMIQSPVDNTLTPFLTFGDAMGNAQRGVIGLRRGSTPNSNTFRLSVGPSVQTLGTHNQDLRVGTTYRIMVKYNGSDTVSLWINNTDPTSTPAFVRTANANSIDIRRLNLRVDSADNMGIFEIDNLIVALGQD
jgi:hypothetical protein